MKITSSKLTENGVLINGSISLPSGNTGHLRDSYNKWLGEGNTPAPQYTESELNKIKASEERAWRDSELNSADVELLKVQDGGAGTVSEWRNYRNALRDYPQQPDFPNGERPVK